jgi:hypothetical protein
MEVEVDNPVIVFEWNAPWTSLLVHVDITYTSAKQINKDIE